jgi:YfiH family protein
MTPLQDTVWNERPVGPDRVLYRAAAGVTMFFGVGPARGSGAEPARLSAVLDHLEPAVVALRFCRQVHGRTIHEIAVGPDPILEVGEGDALVTVAPATGLLVWTADCVPVLIAGDGVVAAVHSGWRGCAADVVGVTVGHLAQSHGSTPEILRAVLGPSVCGPCYRVGPEVTEALGRFGLPESRWRHADHVDLRGFLTARLEALGVPAEQIETVGGCTVESDALASFRRDGAAAGRQWAMVFLNR